MRSGLFRRRTLLRRCTIKRKKSKAAGNVEWAEFSSKPPDFIRRPKRSGAAGEGMRYEERAKDYLAREFGDEFLPGPWMVFKNERKVRWCQPDGLWIDPVRGRITIIEIKYAHCSEAYTQLKLLYEPVLRKALEDAPWEFRCVEMVRWYDPSTRFPGEYNLRPKLEFAEAGEVAVHIWKPRTGK